MAKCVNHFEPKTITILISMEMDLRLNVDFVQMYKMLLKDIEPTEMIHGASATSSAERVSFTYPVQNYTTHNAL